jgi:cytochrome c oxidase assembly protein subunit 15
VSLAVVTSPGWLRAYDSGSADRRSTQALAADAGLRRLAIAAAGVVYVQIVLGAVMRHTGAGLAIPDFPLMFGRIVPPMALLANGPVAIHFAHRVGALVASIIVLATCWRVVAAHRDRPELVRPASLLVALIVLQVTLGAWTVLSGKQVAINTAHLATGALVFVTTVVLALRAHRPFFAAGVVRVPVARRAARVRGAASPAL